MATARKHPTGSSNHRRVSRQVTADSEDDIQTVSGTPRDGVPSQPTGELCVVRRRKRQAERNPSVVNLDSPLNQEYTNVDQETQRLKKRARQVTQSAQVGAYASTSKETINSDPPWPPPPLSISFSESQVQPLFLSQDSSVVWKGKGRMRESMEVELDKEMSLHNSSPTRKEKNHFVENKQRLRPKDIVMDQLTPPPDQIPVERLKQREHVKNSPPPTLALLDWLPKSSIIALFEDSLPHTTNLSKAIIQITNKSDTLSPIFDGLDAESRAKVDTWISEFKTWDSISNGPLNADAITKSLHKFYDVHVVPNKSQHGRWGSIIITSCLLYLFERLLHILPPKGATELFSWLLQELISSLADLFIWDWSDIDHSSGFIQMTWKRLCGICEKTEQVIESDGTDLTVLFRVVVDVVRDRLEETVMTIQDDLRQRYWATSAYRYNPLEKTRRESIVQNYKWAVQQYDANFFAGEGKPIPATERQIEMQLITTVLKHFQHYDPMKVVHTRDSDAMEWINCIERNPDWFDLGRASYLYCHWKNCNFRVPLNIEELSKMVDPNQISSEECLADHIRSHIQFEERTNERQSVRPLPIRSDTGLEPDKVVYIVD